MDVTNSDRPSTHNSTNRRFSLVGLSRRFVSLRSIPSSHPPTLKAPSPAATILSLKFIQSYVFENVTVVIRVKDKCAELGYRNNKNCNQRCSFFHILAFFATPLSAASPAATFRNPPARHTALTRSHRLIPMSWLLDGMTSSGKPRSA
jgi:hypothetical protein